MFPLNVRTHTSPGSKLHGKGNLAVFAKKIHRNGKWQVKEKVGYLHGVSEQVALDCKVFL
jgi:hypothetical protein